MKHMFMLAAAIVVPMVATPSAIAQDHQDHAGAMTPTTAMPYVAKAGASDLYEIQSSQIALEKSRNDRVRSLATMLIEHHRMTTRDVMAAATRDGLQPGAPMLEPKQVAMIEALRGASADGFDRLFLEQQRMAHMEALNLHRTYAKSGDRPALRQVAGKAVPIIEGHIEKARAATAR